MEQLGKISTVSLDNALSRLVQVKFETECSRVTADQKRSLKGSRTGQVGKKSEQDSSTRKPQSVWGNCSWQQVQKKEDLGQHRLGL